MSDIAERLQAAIAAEEAYLRQRIAGSNHTEDGLARLNAGLRRCAADRKMVEIYKGALVAVEVSKGTILAAATKLRLGAYQKMIDQLARGYGLEETPDRAAGEIADVETAAEFGPRPTEEAQ